MDSKYTYNIIHSNSQIWKEQGFLTMKGSPITNEKYIVAFLQAATLPHKAAILHYKGHQKDNIFISISHNLVDTTTKQTSQKMTAQAILPIHCSYTEKETELFKTQGSSQHQGYWFLNNTLILPNQQIKPTLIALQQVFHSNPLSLLHFIKTLSPPTLASTKH
jgi:hypothetical protein